MTMYALAAVMVREAKIRATGERFEIAPTAAVIASALERCP